MLKSVDRMTDDELEAYVVQQENAQSKRRADLLARLERVTRAGKANDMSEQVAGKAEAKAKEYYAQAPTAEAPKVKISGEDAGPFYGPPANMRNRVGCKEATGWPHAFKAWAHRAMRSLQQGNTSKPLRNKDIGEEVNRLRALDDLAPYAWITYRTTNELAQGNGKYWDKINHGCWLPRRLSGE